MHLHRALALPLLLLTACGSRVLGSDTTAHDETSTTVDQTTLEPTTIEPTTSSESDTSTSTEPPPSFVPDTDPMGDPCDTWAQDCPDGEKCVPYASSGSSWDAVKCVPIMGSQAPGEPCTYGGPVEATDDCDATSICWNASEVNGELIGTCHAQCTGTPDNPMCAEGSNCALASDGVLTLCIPSCDPLLQDCDEGLGCYWANIAFNCVLTTSNLPTGSPCGYINDCAPGHLCVDATNLPECMGAACCTNYCDLQGGDAQCDALPGTSCVAFFEQGLAPAGYEDVGVCLLP